MTKKDIAASAVKKLEEKYPVAVCSLEYALPYELLIATRLSAQCTDARVNIVCRELFSKYPTLESIAAADVEDIRKIVKPCGLYKVKGNDVVMIAKGLIERFGGIVPDTIDELLTLQGVGRKTANLIVGDIYHKPCIVCDTHCIRITNRLGLIGTTDPYKAEFELKKLIPEELSGDFCHRLVMLGREICSARAPKCKICPLCDVCKGKK